jgi:hypothetical protein
VPAPEIGLFGVRFLAAADDALCLADEGNSRVLCVRLGCSAEAEAPVP